MITFEQVAPKLCSFALGYQQNELLYNLALLLRRDSAGREELRKILCESPSFCLAVVFDRFAFTWFRAPKRYPKIAVRTLKELLASKGLSQISGEEMWEAFKEHCQAEGLKPNKKNGRRTVWGLTSFASELGQQGLSIATFIAQQMETGNIGDAYLTLRTKGGLGGQKRAAFLLRDMAWILDLEKSIEKPDHYLLQPIDMWVRRTAICFWPELERESNSSVAEKLAQSCIERDLSSVEFNQGTWYFCARHVKNQSQLKGRLRELVNASLSYRDIC